MKVAQEDLIPVSISWTIMEKKSQTVHTDSPSVSHQDVEEINLPVGNNLESRVLDLVNVIKELAATEVKVCGIDLEERNW